MAMRWLDILSCLALLPFSGVMVADPLSKSRSFHLSAHASPGLMPVSFRSCRKVAVFFPQAEMSWSTSFSRGTKGRVSTRWYRGIWKGIPLNL